jgi:hypothetical protein
MLAGGLAILILDRAVTLVKAARNGKNGRVTDPFSASSHELLIDLVKGQERANTILEKICRTLEKGT